MSEKNDVALLVAVFGFHEGNRIEGRTRIQKELCLLKFKYGIPFSFDYKSYFYGPYSEDLSETINTLIGVRLLKETVRSVGYNTYRYDYVLTKEGKAFFEKLCQKTKRPLRKLRKAVEALENISTPRLVSLAKAESGLDSIC